MKALLITAILIYKYRNYLWVVNRWLMRHHAFESQGQTSWELLCQRPEREIHMLIAVWVCSGWLWASGAFINYCPLCRCQRQPLGPAWLGHRLIGGPIDQHPWKLSRYRAGERRSLWGPCSRAQRLISETARPSRYARAELRNIFSFFSNQSLKLSQKAPWEKKKWRHSQVSSTWLLCLHWR